MVGIRFNEAIDMEPLAMTAPDPDVGFYLYMGINETH